MPKDAQETREKALHAFCEEIRRKGGVPWRIAIVDDDRKEFFRGKDLQRYIEAHPTKLEGLVDTKRSVEAQVRELVELMLRLQVVVACDRFYKRPHPGRKHLVKFPRKLAPFARRDQEWDAGAQRGADFFYLWMEDRPMPPWQYAMAVLMVVGILVVCLFPLAPYWLRISVVYFFLGLLAFIFALILVRFLIFLTVFAFTGYEFWLFPNLLSDQVDLVGAFVPLMSFAKPEDGKSHLGTRIGGFIGVGFMMYMFYMYTPDESTMKSFEKANESILDMMHNVNRPGLGPGTGYVPPKFGSDRNIDPDQIRQMRFAEKQRLKEEAQKRKAAAEAGHPLNDTEPEGPTIPDIPEEDDDEEDSARAAPEEEAAGKASEDRARAAAARGAEAPPEASEQKDATRGRGADAGAAQGTDQKAGPHASGGGGDAAQVAPNTGTADPSGGQVESEPSSPEASSSADAQVRDTDEVRVTERDRPAYSGDSPSGGNAGESESDDIRSEL